jgi:hypothetical protein
MTATASRPGVRRFERELDSTLELVDAMRERSRREDVPGWVWLRAARGCWLTGNLDWANDFYRRAATALALYAVDSGRRTGTFESYAAAALGAAWMCGQREVLTDTGRQLDTAAEQMLSSQELPPEPLVRAGLLISRLRGAWFREQSVLVREYEAELERRSAGLDAWSKAAWQASRNPLAHAAMRALTALRASASGRNAPPGQKTPAEVARAAVQDLDKYLYHQRAAQPTIDDVVDEELISLAVALKGHNVPLPALNMPVEAGSVRL